MTLDLTALGLTDRQARIISDLSRSLCMTEADFCKAILLEAVEILLADPKRLGEIVRDKVERRRVVMLTPEMTRA